MIRVIRKEYSRITMASYSGRGGRRGGRRGGGRGIIFDDRSPLARRPGIHFTHGVIDLPTGDRSQGPLPNIVLNHLQWLAHVENLGGTPLVTQCAIVGPNNYIQLKISFDIAVQGQNPSSLSSEPIQMVSIVGWGTPALVKRTYEKTAVQACLQQLNANGYFVPDYSYFLIKSIEEGDSVTTTAERLCRLNEHDMDMFGETFAAKSFHAILEQVMDVVGFSYIDSNAIQTRDWKYQAHLSFFRPYQFSSTLFEIYGSPCDHNCEVIESALIHSLAYFDEVLDFKIGDFNYMDYLRKKNEE